MRRVLLIVGGGIAAYRALELVRLLKADNVSVRSEERRVGKSVDLGGRRII